MTLAPYAEDDAIMAKHADVELRELRIFLTLADELHFGRTAGRLGLSQPTVSEAVRTLERRLGARLFERTSRRVELTQAGTGLRQRLTPALDNLDQALAQTHGAIGGIGGSVRIATTEFTLLPPVVGLASAFEDAHPACTTEFVQSNFANPYALLRSGAADVLANWLAVDEPDLTVGPVIARYERVLAVACGHPFANRESVSVEELADERVDSADPSVPRALLDAIVPPRTPSGRPIKRLRSGGMINEHVAGIALGRFVYPTMRGVTAFERDDIVLVPIRDLPPLPLGLIWRTAAEDTRIRALAEVARHLVVIVRGFRSQAERSPRR
jgi:DNA-binding transcriptional LysR family regulator